VAVLVRLRKVFLLANKNLQNNLKRVVLSKNKHKVAIFGGTLLTLTLVISSFASFFLSSTEGKRVLGANISKIQTVAASTLKSPIVEVTTVPPTATPTVPPTPIPTLTPTNTPKPIATNTPTPNAINPDQYTAEKLNDNTWRVSNISTDDRMANADEIVNALNSYRASHGRASLSVDAFLSSYAKGRAETFASSGSLDGHAAFRSFMDNGGFNQSGFNSLGENSAFIAGPMNAEKIVKNIFGADPAHDSNQLDSWTHVGVGVNGNAVNVNFGRDKR
jgi:uncharacterized protein YkwD